MRVGRGHYSLTLLTIGTCIYAHAQLPEAILAKAKEGNPDAQFAVGDFYTISPNYSQAMAIEWFRKAANQGYIKAQVRLVHLLSSGSGALMNFKEAFSWAEKAAAQDDTDGIYWLGYCYGSGVAVKQDPKKALAYFRVAASRGNPKYQYDLAEDLLNGEEVLPDPIEAYKWYKLAAEQKHPDAMVMAAVCMLGGKVTEKNVKGAIQLFDQGVALGSKIANRYQPAFDSARKASTTN
ncbi:MAG: sel1 repeat family protein [Acidobacteria bacterium]|nr:sel1 repeat family protein [Acidobacteriota bacterium]